MHTNVYPHAHERLTGHPEHKCSHHGLFAGCGGVGHRPLVDLIGLCACVCVCVCTWMGIHVHVSVLFGLCVHTHTHITLSHSHTLTHTHLVGGTRLGICECEVAWQIAGGRETGAGSLCEDGVRECECAIVIIYTFAYYIISHTLTVRDHSLLSFTLAGCFCLGWVTDILLVLIVCVGWWAVGWCVFGGCVSSCTLLSSRTFLSLQREALVKNKRIS
jgi:hypothetical protein